MSRIKIRRLLQNKCVLVVTSVSISEEEDDVSEEGEEGITKPAPSLSISSLAGRPPGTHVPLFRPPRT
jgi:hypothetical protein